MTFAYRSKASLASIVSLAVDPFCRCTKDNPLKWSTKIVAILYRLYVMNPFIFGINPGTADIIWSTDTTDPGAVTGGTDIAFTSALDLHGHRVSLPNKHAAPLGTEHDASADGKSPRFASCCILPNGKCPNL